MIGTSRAADRDTTLGLGVNAVLDLQADHLEDAGEFDVVSTSSVARSSTVRLRFCVPAARSLPSPGSPRSNRRMATVPLGRPQGHSNEPPSISSTLCAAAIYCAERADTFAGQVLCLVRLADLTVVFQSPLGRVTHRAVLCVR